MLVDTLQARLQQQYDLSIPYQVDKFISHDATLAQHLREHVDDHWLTTSSRQDSESDSLNDAQSDTAGTSLKQNRRTSAASGINSSELPHETLFISQSSDTLEFTLYLDKSVLMSASRTTHANEQGTLHPQDNQSLENFCTVVEGVSHAVCLLWHAHHNRQIRAIDLELQAEVDKYLLLLSSCNSQQSRDLLHRQLFANASFIMPAGSELYYRYKAASDFAAIYCTWLMQHFNGPDKQQSLNQELARFYRLSGSAKFERIRRLH